MFSRNTEPTTPEGFKFDSKSYGDDGKISHYNYSKEVKGKANWGDFRKIELLSPVGYNESIGERRFYGYFPIAGFYTGAMEIMEATNDIYNNVIANQGRFETSEKVNDEKTGSTLKKRTIHIVEFSLAQRATILLVSVASYVRGLVTFCQLGILFAPLDFVGNTVGKYCCKA